MIILFLYFLKIRIFFGGDNKGEIIYDIWRYEVKMVLKDLGYIRE